MAEPTSTGVLAAAMAGAGLAGALAGINPEAAVGALCGALVFFMSNQELPMFRRLAFLVISFVMGIMFAPALANASMFGFGPINLPGPAAFISSALVITVTLAAIKQRRGMEGTHG